MEGNFKLSGQVTVSPIRCLSSWLSCERCHVRRMPIPASPQSSTTVDLLLTMEHSSSHLSRSFTVELALMGAYWV